MLTKLNYHDNHQVRVHLTRQQGPHYAALRCVSCNRHIQWLSQKQAEQINQILKQQA